MNKKHIIYECGICDCYHPWEWNGDCRDDVNRYAGVDVYAKKHNISEFDIEVRSMDDRVEADRVGDRGPLRCYGFAIQF